MYIPNDWSSNPENAICQKCTCSSDGNPTDCIINYYCDLGLGSLCAKYKNVAGKCCPVCGKSVTPRFVSKVLKPATVRTFRHRPRL